MATRAEQLSHDTGKGRHQIEEYQVARLAAKCTVFDKGLANVNSKVRATPIDPSALRLLCANQIVQRKRFQQRGVVELGNLIFEMDVPIRSAFADIPFFVCKVR